MCSACSTAEPGRRDMGDAWARLGSAGACQQLHAAPARVVPVHACKAPRSSADVHACPQLYRMVRRYGLSYLYFMPLPRRMGRAFQRLYSPGVAAAGHSTPQQLLQAADLYDLTQASFEAAVQASPATLGPARACAAVEASRLALHDLHSGCAGETWPGGGRQHPAGASAARHVRRCCVTQLPPCLQAKLGTSEPARRFSDEVLAAINRINYGQDHLSALAGRQACWQPLSAAGAAPHMRACCLALTCSAGVIQRRQRAAVLQSDTRSSCRAAAHCQARLWQRVSGAPAEAVLTPDCLQAWCPCCPRQTRGCSPLRAATRRS